MTRFKALQADIRTAINRHSAENDSDTPDFLLAEFLVGCLERYNRAVLLRDLGAHWDGPEGRLTDFKALEADIRTAINRHSAENDSDTPDFLLAEFLVGCLERYNRAVFLREQWYGRKLRRANAETPQPANESREEPQRKTELFVCDTCVSIVGGEPARLKGMGVCAKCGHTRMGRCMYMANAETQQPVGDQQSTKAGLVLRQDDQSDNTGGRSREEPQQQNIKHCVLCGSEERSWRLPGK